MTKDETAFYDFIIKQNWQAFKNGHPDFFCFKDKKYMFVEVKKSSGSSLSECQKKMMDAFTKVGIDCYKWFADTQKLIKHKKSHDTQELIEYKELAIQDKSEVKQDKFEAKNQSILYPSIIEKIELGKDIIIDYCRDCKNSFQSFENSGVRYCGVCMSKHIKFSIKSK